MAFTRDIEINAPISYVFDKSTNFEIASNIIESVVRTEVITEGPLQKGTQIKEVRVLKGKEVETILTITNYNEHQNYSVKSETNGIIVEYHYGFTETTNGTHVHFEGHIEVSGMKKIFLKPLVKFMLIKEDGDHLDRLKNYIEHDYTIAGKK